VVIATRTPSWPRCVTRPRGIPAPPAPARAGGRDAHRDRRRVDRGRCSPLCRSLRGGVRARDGRCRARDPEVARDELYSISRRRPRMSCGRRHRGRLPHRRLCRPADAGRRCLRRPPPCREIDSSDPNVAVALPEGRLVVPPAVRSRLARWFRRKARREPPDLREPRNSVAFPFARCQMCTSLPSSERLLVRHGRSHHCPGGCRCEDFVHSWGEGSAGHLHQPAEEPFTCRSLVITGQRARATDMPGDVVGEDRKDGVQVAALKASYPRLSSSSLGCATFPCPSLGGLSASRGGDGGMLPVPTRRSRAARLSGRRPVSPETIACVGGRKLLMFVRHGLVPVPGP